MQLYKIAAEIERLVTDAEGDLTPETEAALDALTLTREQKALDIACLIRSLELEAEAVRAEATRLSDRASALTKRAKWFRQYLAQFMPEDATYKDARLQVRSASTRSPNYAEDFVAPARFVEIVEQVKKGEIKKALEAGEEIPGAWLVTNRHVVIR